MSSKDADDLLAQLDSLSSPPTTRTARTPITRPTRQTPSTQSQTEQDLLAELGNLAQRPTSRPGTPSLRAPTAATISRSPNRASTDTPPPGQTIEDKSSNGQRHSGDSTRSTHQMFTPATTTTDESPEPTPQPAPTPARSGGWWGGILSTATTAISQAQAVVKDLQQNEEAQKWAEQVRGNVDALKGFGGELRSMAIPTFQNLLQTIAPPISAHERLQIHITHDLTNYPSLDPLVYAVFSRVMSQVEGGDLMVIQKGAESRPNRKSTDSSRPSSSWHDGPWWRSTSPRSISSVRGMQEGSKLVRTAAETYAREYFATKGGVEEAAKRATEKLNDTNPTRDSQIFFAIQAITQEVDKHLFSASLTKAENEGQVLEPTAESGSEVVFAMYLHDPIHGIAFATISQAVPQQWVDWLDATVSAEEDEGALPESIEEIVESGGLDPREWVSEWVEETLNLAVGVVAQRYVARRMGVGAAKGKGKLKSSINTQDLVESGGGEAARAMGGM